MGFFDSIKNAARDAQRQADAMAQEVAHKAQQVIETDDRRKLDELVGQLDSNADAWIAGAASRRLVIGWYRIPGGPRFEPPRDA